VTFFLTMLALTLVPAFFEWRHCAVSGRPSEDDDTELAIGAEGFVVSACRPPRPEGWLWVRFDQYPEWDLAMDPADVELVVTI
jgi:hypothetical protein